jgi:hypothetical protein
MTMPEERTRALIWAGGFLMELAQDGSLPLDLRRRAAVVARHFPTVEDISSMAMAQCLSVFGVGLSSPDEIPDAVKDCRFGALKYSTRLVWPEDG